MAECPIGEPMIAKEEKIEQRKNRTKEEKREHESRSEQALKHQIFDLSTGGMRREESLLCNRRGLSILVRPWFWITLRWSQTKAAS